MLRIIGIDHSCTCTGIGVIEVDDKKEVSYIHHSYNRLDTSKYPYPVSMYKQTLWVKDKIEEYLPSVVVLEGPKDTRGFIATQRLIEVLGSIKTQLVNMNTPFIEIPPSTMKKIIAGNGFATKEEVALSISNLFSIPFEDLVGFTYYKQGIKKGQVKGMILDGTDALGLAVAGVTYIPRIGKLDYSGGR